MSRWFRRLWIWINTPPIDLIAPDFEIRRQQLDGLATGMDRRERRMP